LKKYQTKSIQKMKNIIFLLTILIVVSACETEPKDYVTHLEKLRIKIMTLYKLKLERTQKLFT